MYTLSVDRFQVLGLPILNMMLCLWILSEFSFFSEEFYQTDSYFSPPQIWALEYQKYLLHVTAAVYWHPN